AAVRSARALEDTVAHQRLEDLLKMPRRQVVAHRQRFGRDRASTCVERKSTTAAMAKALLRGTSGICTWTLKFPLPYLWNNPLLLILFGFSVCTAGNES